jgi:hypothetical protein
MRRLTEKVNMEIMENELAAVDWELNPLAWELYWWVHAFQIRFFADEPMPIPALTFEKSRVTTLGHYRIGRNDFAVREQINLNKLHLNRPLWDILATLLHEMVHCWEYCHLPEKDRTKNWYHPKKFREKMQEFGIVCDEKGCHVGLIRNGLFAWTLRQNAVELNSVPNYQTEGVVPIEPKKKPKGKSKLKKWSCGCTNIRVAVQDFQAECLKCGNIFELVD